MNSCFDADDVDSCGDLCSDPNAETLFGYYDCWFAWYHSLYWHYGLCDYYGISSHDSDTTGYTCPIMAQGTFETSGTDICDDYTSASSMMSTGMADPTATPTMSSSMSVSSESMDEDQVDSGVFTSVNPGLLSLIASAIVSLLVVPRLMG